MSMAQGFAQGFGMMNNFMQQQYDKERQEAIDAENTRRYNESIDWRNKQAERQIQREMRQDGIEDERRILDYASKGITSDMTPEQKQGVILNQRAIALQQAEEDRQWGRKKDELSMQRDRSAMAFDAIRRDAALVQLNDANIQAGLSAALIGDEETAKKYLPKTLIGAWAKRADAANAYANQYLELDKAYQQAQTKEEKEQILEAMNRHIMADTPEARALFNSANYQSYAERIKANPNIESISHTGFMPVNGGYVPMMEIKYKDKEKSVIVPATKFRTSREDDEAVLLSTSTIKQRAAEALTLMGSAKRMAEENPIMAQKLGLKEKPATVGYGTKLVDPSTGKVIAENDRNAQRGLTANQNVAALQSLKNQTDKQIKELSDKLMMLPKDERMVAMQQLEELRAYSLRLTDGMAQAGVYVPQTETTTTTGQFGMPTNMQSTTSGKAPQSGKFDFAGRLGVAPASIPDKK